MWQNYFQPLVVDAALDLLQQYAGQARIVAGGTDLVVELQRGIRPTKTVIDISKIADLKYIREENGIIRLGALTTHSEVLASALCRERALPLAQACIEIGAPQIRTRATVAGNLITGSPANDTIAPLMALGAEIVIVSKKGKRAVSLDSFYIGVRRTVLQPDEMVREIRFPALTENERGLWKRLGLRRAQAISVVDAAIVLSFDGATVKEAWITMGSVTPVIIHAKQAEQFLVGKQLDPASCAEAARLAADDARPIGDLRASAGYRLTTIAEIVASGLQTLAEGKERANFPASPVLLDSGQLPDNAAAQYEGVIETTINGQRYSLPNAQDKTLLNAIRQDAGLTGSKEGCAEGECGACTIWINGQAAMSCLAPAPQAHNAVITTIEGLADGETLHPLQQAYIDHASVQCGFCIPGMLMAGAKLLEERPQIGLAEAQAGISGNICRCTGYRKILDAMLAVGGGANE